MTAPGFDWAVVPTWIAAGAGMIGALAAWRAASASASTSRDAAEALGIAIKPTITVIAAMENGRIPILMISNASRFDAKDVRVTVKMRDGQEVEAHTERLAAAVTLANQPVEPPFRVELPEIPDPVSDLVGKVSALHVRYSDDRRLSRYDYSWRVETSRTDVNGILSYGRTLTEGDDRIDGPGIARFKKPDWLWPSPP